MNKVCETLLVVLMGVGPAAILISLMQQYGPLGVAVALTFTGVYLLMVVLGMVVNRYVKGRTHTLQQPQQGEDHQNLQAAEDDFPPSYDTVMAKPPPYQLLFGSSVETSRDISGYDVTTDTNTVTVPVHHQRLLRDNTCQDKRGGIPWTVHQSEPSPPPPPYSQVVVTLSNDTSPLIVEPGGSSPEGVEGASYSPQASGTSFLPT